MRASTDRILTTHVGNLPAPLDLWVDAQVDGARLRSAVSDIITQQRTVGLDIVNEGEVTKDGGTVNLLTQSADWKGFG